MKISNPVLVYFASLLVTTTSARTAELRANPEENNVPKDKTVRNLHGGNIQQGGAQSDGAAQGEQHHARYYYYTGSCSCVGDAIDDILEAASDAVEKLPFDEETHGFLMDVVHGLAHCAIDFLHGLDCGCDHDYHGIPQQQKLTYPYLKTDTYSCCCDVEAIKEATIHQIEAVACSWNVDMNGLYMGQTVEKLCNFDFYASAYARLGYLIKQVGGQYLKALFYPPSSYMCSIDPSLTCPEVTPPVVCNSGEGLIITGVVDADADMGQPKAIELYVLTDILDLNVYGLGSASNGDGSDGQEYTFPPGTTASAGSYLYVANDLESFQSYFGFMATYLAFGTGAASFNGDDAIELFKDGVVVDVFGEINIDGTGHPWEYKDGWAYRKNGSGPDGQVFTVENWIFSGPLALDDRTTNTGPNSFPVKTYSPCV